MLESDRVVRSMRSASLNAALTSRTFTMRKSTPEMVRVPSLNGPSPTESVMYIRKPSIRLTSNNGFGDEARAKTCKYLSKSNAIRIELSPPESDACWPRLLSTAFRAIKSSL